MSERKFTRGLGKPGMAAQVRETVSQVVRESTVQSKPQLVDPIDFENFVLKNKTILQNDTHRELLLYPSDDVSQVVLPRRYRTVTPVLPSKQDIIDCNLFTRMCISTYSSNWNLVHYKYNAYSATFAELPKPPKPDDLNEDVYEIDTDVDKVDNDETNLKNTRITKQGYLMKGPELSSERMFPNIGSKTFKKRYCFLRQEVDGTYILELYKDEKKGDAKVTIVMDFCTDVVPNQKRGKFCFELRMTAGHKSYSLAADTEIEYKDWISKLGSVLQQNKVQEEKRAASLERTGHTTPPQSPSPSPIFGTLKSLEQSMNPQLIKYARETEISIAHSRREKRRKIFNIYPPLTTSPAAHPTLTRTTSLNFDQIIEPYREQFGQRIFVNCESIKFKLQTPQEDDVEHLCQLEPYHTTLCLFDARNNKKLTENFHFDVNQDMARQMIQNLQNDDLESSEIDEKYIPEEWIMYPRQCILSVMNPHPDIFLVVRIDKILQGGICQVAEPYLKSTKDPKVALKLHKTVKSYCQRTCGKYRQPFAWAARPLFRMYSNELDTGSDFPAIYRQESNRITDEEMLKLLSEYRKPDKFSRLTVIPGVLKVRIEVCTELPENSLTTSLAPLKPYPLPPIKDPTIEITEFEGNVEKDVNPYATFVNHLYVYPQTLMFDTQKIFARARNIACVIELRDSDSSSACALRCIYGRPNNRVLVKQTICAVLHHNTTPSWYDEIKIRLPIQLSSNHHLLFTFYHVSCELSKKRENGIESCVGYAWIPLLQKGKLNIETQIVPVATHLPNGYLSIQPLGLGKGNSGPEVIWVDSQRAIFTVSFNLVSSVNTKDQHLHNLFIHSERLLDTKPSAMPSENETCKILKALHAIQLTTLITFLPTLLTHLFTILCGTTNDEIGLNIIRVMINLIHMVHDAGRKDILQSYVKYVFVPPNLSELKGTTVHVELAKHLPTILHPNNTDFLVVNKFMQHSIFFFEIMIKSMAQHLLSTGRIKMHRNERFSTEYIQKIETLLQVLVPYITSKHKEMIIETQELNRSLALFLKKSLSFMDRGIVFRLINLYIEKFHNCESRSLNDLKFQFLQIICSHEHYIVLNLPLYHTRLSPKSRSPDYLSEYCLSEEFCKHHFLVALLLQEVKTALNEVITVRKTALSTLRDLLAKHEADDRYQSKGQLSRIAMLYVPWLGIVIENLHRLNSVDPKVHGDEENTHSIVTHTSSSMSYLNKYANNVNDVRLSHRFTMHLDHTSPAHLRDSTYFAAIAGQNNLLNGNSSMSLDSDVSTMSGDGISTVSQETTIIREITDENGLTNGVHKPSEHARSVSIVQNNHTPRFDKLQLYEVKDMLICVLFVLKYIGEENLLTWWQQCSDTETFNFFTLLEKCLYCFKYNGKQAILAATQTKGGVDAKIKPVKAHTLPARMNPPDFSGHNSGGDTSTLTTHSNRENLVKTETESSRLQQVLLEGNMATEVGLIALDCVGLYSMHFRAKLMENEGDNIIMRKLFDIYLTYLQVGQSETLLQHVFAALRAHINQYSIVLFKGNAALCGNLCYEVLRCCNSRLSSVRQEACAILYLLMRSNFEFSSRKGLTRVHLQVIISVSQMLGNVVVCGLNNARFQESLSLINSYATSDKAMKGTGFPMEVKDLTKRIRTVLMATLQMREHHHDPEMLVDLQHSLANSYASTPELRRTWLETMTRNHVTYGNFSEAACCQLHIAALMAEYLKLKNIHDWGAEMFTKISSNITHDERGLKLDAGVQDVQYTEFLLLEQLETCVECLEKAERYELLGELYRLIIPMYEKKRRYSQLIQCYQNLSKAYSKVMEVIKSGKRLLGRFYRVAFYGQAYFEDDSGVEYIYKEPKVTTLSEISERLQNQFSQKFGAEVVKMIMDSIPVDQSELDQKYAYIQVTHVTPYFEKTELEERQTEFEQNHDINCFMYETPFTRDGKARGQPEEQWKRRTILTTQYSFPYVKKRIIVTARRTQELSPIEVAIDEMSQRVSELEDVVFTEPTDVKKLQLRLQGSVCVQVNAGPLAYASVFLDPTLSNLYPDDKVDELKDIFREFLKISYTALQINSKLITSDQNEYQEALRQNYKKLCTSLSTLFGEPLWPHEETGSFKRNSIALFSAISGANHNSSTA